ncbi:MAG TPA: PLP-dependent aminotransferase family protein [Streptosporangiaceae bacterium]|nr:PLP-dependent aminotransferase family protein [Streptosporangiaceae bacterium]
MTAALEQHDWSTGLAQRTRTLGGGEITAILALAGATDVITFSGGFPDPATFPTETLGQIAGRLIAGDAAVALQYTATEGIAGVRDYVAGRLESLEGARPGPGELMITSGGIDCMELLAKSYVDPGDVVVVESPTYLGGIMAFRGYEADVRGVPMDGDGMRVDVLADLLAGGLRPKIVYTIPDYQNPTGLSMSAERRTELAGLARRYGFLICEDVAYRELGFGAPPPASLWSLAPDVVLQAGTGSKIFFPGVRLGWAAGPRQVIGRLVVAKQNSDQCSGALGQRMFEEYGRAGHLDRQLVASRALYARRAELVTQALAAHMPDGTTWTTPHGGFYVWLTAPGGVDTVALSAAARVRKVAYVPGRPFYPGDAGATQIRLAYSRVADHLIDEGIRRIGEVLKTGLEPQ